jgi:hypothetical protein
MAQLDGTAGQHRYTMAFANRLHCVQTFEPSTAIHNILGCTMSTSSYAEYPPKADLRNVSKPLPKIPPGTVNPASIDSSAVMARARSFIDAFNIALSSDNIEKLSEFFYEQAYWRDIVALTSHLRTIESPRVIATALLHTINLRGLKGNFEMMGDPHFVVMSPSMVNYSFPASSCNQVNVLTAKQMFIDCGISFHTISPSLRCAGRMVLLPVNTDGDETWKVWVVSTWVEDLAQYPENRELLRLPGKCLNEQDIVATDVLVIGAGTSYVS